MDIHFLNIKIMTGSPAGKLGVFPKIQFHSKARTRFIDETVEGFSSKKHQKNPRVQTAKKNPQPGFWLRTSLSGLLLWAALGTPLSQMTNLRFCTTSFTMCQESGRKKPGRGVCRTEGIESEKEAERGLIMAISPAHSGTMGIESGKIGAAETRLQPIHPQSDRLPVTRKNEDGKNFCPPYSPCYSRQISV